MEVFPAELPALMNRGKFSGQQGDNLLRTSMSTGPAKVRRRTTSAPITRRLGHQGYTTAQLQQLLAFHRDNLADGALRFEMADPVDVLAAGGVAPVTSVFRFTEPPSYEPGKWGRWSITCELEILP